MVHQYKSHGFNIVLDVESGAVHIVDDVVYDLIPHMEDKEALSISETSTLTGNKYSDTDLEEAINEINELRDSGALYSKDIY